MKINIRKIKWFSLLETITLLILSIMQLSYFFQAMLDGRKTPIFITMLVAIVIILGDLTEKYEEYCTE